MTNPRQGTWGAQAVKRLTLAGVTISRFVGSSLALGSTLTVQSLVGFSLPLSRSLKIGEFKLKTRKPDAKDLLQRQNHSKHPPLSWLLRVRTRLVPGSSGSTPARSLAPRGLHPPGPRLLRVRPVPVPRQPRRGGRAARTPSRTRAAADGWPRLAREPPRRGRARYPPARLAASACCPRTSRAGASSRVREATARTLGSTGTGILTGLPSAIAGQAAPPSPARPPPGPCPRRCTFAVPPRVRRTPPRTRRPAHTRDFPGGLSCRLVRRALDAKDPF